MKPRLTPTEILLKELPPEGRDFHYSNETGELNQTLKDLIGTGAFAVDLKITPMGNTFDLRGTIATSLGLQCSLCASDFNFPVKQNVHELIVIARSLGKNDHLGKVNHAHEWTEGPDYITLESELFNVGNYVHEQVALAEPIRPLCAPEKPEGCANANDRIDRPWLSYGGEEKPGTAVRANTFQVLEKMKVKS